MRKYLLIFLTFLAAQLALSKGDACAEDKSIQLKIYPDTIMLSKGETASVALAVANPFTETLSKICIKPVPVNGLKAAVLPADNKGLIPYDVAPLSDLAVVVQITRSGEIDADSKQYFQLDYEDKYAKRSAFASLNVRARPILPADQVATLKVETALTSLFEQRKGWIYLILTNTTSWPIEVLSVDPRGPEFVVMCPKVNAPTTLNGQNTLSIPVEISVKDTVQPASYILLFNVSFSQTQRGTQQQYQLVQKHTIEVTVLGESEILKVLQVPSILILPGLLTVITLGLIWKVFSKSEKKDQFPLKFKSEEFWVVAILVSISIALFYPKFTEWVLKQRRDYVYGYGIKDVVWIWLIGIGAAAALSIVFVFAKTIYKYIKMLCGYVKAWCIRHKYPTAQDNPITLLKKINRQGLKIGLEEVKLKDGSQVFLLQEIADTRTTYWVSSKIKIQYPDDLDPGIEKAVSEQLVLDGDPGVVLEKITEGNIIILDQDIKPTSIARTEIQEYHGRQVCVDVV